MRTLCEYIGFITNLSINGLAEYLGIKLSGFKQGLLPMTGMKRQTYLCKEVFVLITNIFK